MSPFLTTLCSAPLRTRSAPPRTCSAPPRPRSALPRSIKKKQAAHNAAELAAQKKAEERNKAFDRKREEDKKQQLAMLSAPNGARQLAVSNEFPADGALVGGDGFVQLGDWRIGSGDDRHLVIQHKERPTFSPTLYTIDGQVFREREAPNAESRLWDKPLTATGKKLKNVKVEKGFMWFRGFRIGDSNGQHASVSHKKGKTAQIWRNDGTVHPGPRTDWAAKTRDASVETTKGYKYIDFGSGTNTWRFGQQDPEGYFVIAHMGTKKSVATMSHVALKGSVSSEGLRSWFKSVDADANGWRSRVGGFVGRRADGTSALLETGIGLESRLFANREIPVPTSKDRFARLQAGAESRFRGGLQLGANAEDSQKWGKKGGRRRPPPRRRWRRPPPPPPPTTTTTTTTPNPLNRVYANTEAGHGARKGVRNVRGEVNGRFQFGDIIPATFTICSLSRYIGQSRGAILQSKRQDWFHGHFGDRAGVAYYAGRWTTGHVDNACRHCWVAMCGKNRGKEAYVNDGKNVATGDPGGTGGNADVWVNEGRHGRSDWAVAEVITWDRLLDTEEMRAADRYLWQDVMGNPAKTTYIGRTLGKGIWEPRSYCFDAAVKALVACLPDSPYQQFNFIPLPEAMFPKHVARYTYMVSAARVGNVDYGSKPPNLDCMTGTGGNIDLETCAKFPASQQWQVVPYRSRYDRYLLTQGADLKKTSCMSYDMKAEGVCDADANNASGWTYGAQWIFPKVRKPTGKFLKVCARVPPCTPMMTLRRVCLAIRTPSHSHYALKYPLRV